MLKDFPYKNDHVYIQFSILLPYLLLYFHKKDNDLKKFSSLLEESNSLHIFHIAYYYFLFKINKLTKKSTINIFSIIITNINNIYL